MQLFGAIGLASLGTIATTQTRSLSAAGEPLASALTGGFRLAYLVAAACVALGIVAAALILRPPADVAQEAELETLSAGAELGALDLAA